jgi:hypothetical protein
VFSGPDWSLPQDMWLTNAVSAYYLAIDRMIVRYFMGCSEYRVPLQFVESGGEETPPVAVGLNNMEAGLYGSPARLSLIKIACPPVFRSVIWESS